MRFATSFFKKHLAKMAAYIFKQTVNMLQEFLNADSLTNLQLLTYLSFYFTITALRTVGVVHVEVWRGAVNSFI